MRGRGSEGGLEGDMERAGGRGTERERGREREREGREGREGREEREKPPLHSPVIGLLHLQHFLAKRSPKHSAQ